MSYFFMVFLPLLLFSCVQTEKTPSPTDKVNWNEAKGVSKEGVGQGNGLTTQYFLKAENIGLRYAKELKLTENKDGSIIISEIQNFNSTHPSSQLEIGAFTKVIGNDIEDLRAAGNQLYPGEYLEETKVGAFPALQVINEENGHYSKVVIFISPEFNVIRAKADINTSMGGSLILPILDTLSFDITPPQVLDSKIELKQNQIVVKLKIIDDVSGIHGYRGGMIELNRCALERCETKMQAKGILNKYVSGHDDIFSLKNEGNDWYSFIVEINSYAPTGDYKFWKIGIVDNARNYNWYELPGHIHFENTTIVDDRAPEVQKIKGPGTCYAGENCRILFKVTDNLSGVNFQKSGYLNLGGDWYGYDYKINAWAESGVYFQKAIFSFEDWAGNTSVFYPNNFQVEVINHGPTDQEAPQILDYKFPDKVERGKQYKMLIKIKDNLSGLDLNSMINNQFYFFYKENHSFPSFLVAPGELRPLENDWYETTFTVSPYLHPGIYYNDSNVSVKDNARNYSAEILPRGLEVLVQ